MPSAKSIAIDSLLNRRAKESYRRTKHKISKTSSAFEQKVTTDSRTSQRQPGNRMAKLRMRRITD
jgi:hypothetical protein